MIAIGAIPRTLAADWSLMAKGSRALLVFPHAFNATMEHLQDLGGRIAPSESKLFATIAAHRQWLSSYLWPTIRQTIDVVHHMGDLDASLSTNFVCTTALSRARIHKSEKYLKG